MATGDLIQLQNVAVQSIRCTTPPDPCEITLAGGIIGIANGDRILTVLMAAAAAGRNVTVWYVESKPVPFDAQAGTPRLDLIVDATL